MKLRKANEAKSDHNMDTSEFKNEAVVKPPVNSRIYILKTQVTTFLDKYTIFYSSSNERYNQIELLLLINPSNY